MTVMDVAFVCAEVPRDVVLVHPGGRPLDVVRVVRRLTGLSLWRSKALVDQAPVVILDRLPEEAAESAVAALREAGGQAELGQRTQPHLSGACRGTARPSSSRSRTQPQHEARHLTLPPGVVWGDVFQRLKDPLASSFAPRILPRASRAAPLAARSSLCTA